MTRESNAADPAEWLAILDGAGSLCIVAGVMAALALILTPEVWPTFVPLAVGGIVGGAVLVRWARRPTQPATAEDAGE
jgi:hypothetical protein